MSAQVSPQFASTILPGTPPVLLGVIEDAARGVFERHGVSAFAAPRAAAAAHETGHAIVGTHEGFRIRRITISSRSAPIFGELLWGGRCMEAAATWSSGPDTTADDDLRRARFIIAGLVGEGMAKVDRPGSSLDELALSQLVGMNAAEKLAGPGLSDAEYSAYAKRLWYEQIWGVAFKILRNNFEPFKQLFEHLQRHDEIRGPKLCKMLVQVRRIEA